MAQAPRGGARVAGEETKRYFPSKVGAVAHACANKSTINEPNSCAYLGPDICTNASTEQLAVNTANRRTYTYTDLLCC